MIITASEENTPLVLIVDDDATMRLLMRHTLKKAGFHVEEAGDGLPALQIFREKKPDIILLDVMMPGMDGYRTCAEIRKIPGGEHIPILMVTGLDDMESINQAYEAGATDFITKPITYPLLGHRVRYALRASQAMANVGKSQASLAHAQAIAHLGNWEWNLAENTMLWSDEIYRILGLSTHTENATTVKPSIESLLKQVYPEDHALFSSQIDAAVKTGNTLSFDHRILMPDGKVRIVHEQGEIMFNEQGIAILMNGTTQDITERKSVENELAQYRNHLEELVEKRTVELTGANAQLRKAKEQAEQANELKDKFVSLVAHDLRSPLAGIISALEYLYTDDEAPLNEDHQDIVRRLLEIGKSAIHLIEDVLNISRLKTGKLTPKPKFLNARQKVEKTINNLSYLAKQKGVELVNDVPDDVRLFADIALLGEVMQNLASNSIKFCKKGDIVRFFVPADRPSTIGVQDTGIGIPAENLPKLFKIEEKTSTTGTAGEKGTGFGLPFSQDIMLAHNGGLTVESELGKGTTFFINLPLITPTVLVIDQIDNERATLKNLLQQFSIRVLESTNKEEGFTLAEQEVPHLIFCDLTDCELNSTDYVNRLKQNPVTKDISLIMMSTLTDETILNKLVNMGVDDFLRKPLDNSEVIKRLENILLIPPPVS
ncbi:response regulator [Beggiatoa leptomitoformis]|uniref:histidine kinase n=1 Tax=Beggiatoa leptomitoformis TaxID=288004 RepID=A0A2N9YBT5_9GAMM|nr:response regulator [Beggiatoa leptomitoformis]AUI67854.1 response regulator [Beggiatoa leptomitoformis]QGX03496.1 response regulator [Beggiatoa leptomitoformis]